MWSGKSYFIFLATTVGFSKTLHTDSILGVHVNLLTVLAGACAPTLNNTSTWSRLNYHLASPTVKDPIAAGICGTGKEMGVVIFVWVSFLKMLPLLFSPLRGNVNRNVLFLVVRQLSNGLSLNNIAK